MLPSLSEDRKGRVTTATHSRPHVAEKQCTWLGSPEAEAATLSLGVPRPPLLPSATHTLSEHPVAQEQR